MNNIIRWTFAVILTVTTARAGDISGGETFVDGQQVTAARLNNHVNNAIIKSSLISGKTSDNPAAADSLLFYSSSGDVLRRVTGTNFASSLLGIYYGYQAVGNTNYTILTTDKILGTTTSFTANRTWTLPSASGFGSKILYFADLSGAINGVNFLTFTRAGSDTIEPGGLTSLDYKQKGGGLIFTSNGVDKWAVISTTQKEGANGSLSTVSGGYATDTYLAGSAVTIKPAGSWQLGGIYHCRFDMTKTAAGTATPIVTVRMGTAGTTSDAAVTTLTFAAGTAAADAGVFDIYVNFRSIGGSGQVGAMGSLQHQLASTGLTTVGTAGCAIATNVSGSFDTTTPTIIGLSFNGGTSFSGTNVVVQADYKQP